MADVKWIKVYTSMVSNKKIKKIRRLPEGNNIILIWVFLLAQAGESNKDGGLFITDTIPFTVEDLADEFDFKPDVIRLALKVLENFAMIEIFEDVIYIKNWGEYQNIEGLDKIREQTRLRVAKHRENKKKLMEPKECQYCGAPATGYDHIIATARGGSDDDDNKIPCCIECNRIKNDKPLVEFLNNNRARVRDDIILNNWKLKRYIELCNVTNRYKVTHSNATEEEIELERDIDIDIYKDIESKGNDGKPSPPPETKKEVKHKYGEYNHVMLTDKDYNKLIEAYGEDKILLYIKKVDEYVEQTGKKYKNHYLTIKNWISKDKDNKQPSKTVTYRKENKATDYEGQRQYDYDNLEDQFLSKYQNE